MNTTQSKLSGRERGYLEHLRRARSDGLTIAQYCRAEGLNAQCLYNISSHLARKGIPSHRGESAAMQLSKPSGQFLAVRVTPTTPIAPSGAVCRLRHPNGWVMECAGWPPASWLSQLLDGGDDAAT